MIEGYGGLVLSGILTLTQLLSMFGIAVDINVMAWHLSTMLFMPLLALTIGSLRFWAYEKFYADVSAGNANAGNSRSLMNGIELDCVKMTVMGLSASTTLAINWEQ